MSKYWKNLRKTEELMKKKGKGMSREKQINKSGQSTRVQSDRNRKKTWDQPDSVWWSGEAAKWDWEQVESHPRACVGEINKININTNNIRFMYCASVFTHWIIYLSSFSKLHSKNLCFSSCYINRDLTNLPKKTILTISLGLFSLHLTSLVSSL